MARAQPPTSPLSSSAAVTIFIPSHLSRVSGLEALRVAREHRRLADVVEAAVEHHDALEADAAAAVRRRADAERVDVGLDRLDVDAARGRALCVCVWVDWVVLWCWLCVFDGFECWVCCLGVCRVAAV